jgi:starvation-inducible DNA-binding protein
MKTSQAKKTTAPTAIGAARGAASRAAETFGTGIDGEARAQIAASVAKVLAETYALYTKTQGYHWNVTGAQFPQLHILFEGQYEELATAVDLVAERIRALGSFAPGDLTALRSLATIPDDSDRPDATTMVERLLAGHEAVARAAREAIPAADEADDAATVDLLTVRAAAHEKAAWMLRSVID